MDRLLFITHPEVIIDPLIPVERWRLSAAGIARMRTFAESTQVARVRSIWASSETKAIQAAGLLGARLGIGTNVDAGLGENDRSATGFLAPAEFESVADIFFAHPEKSIRGWERAIDAQQRIRQAVERIVSRRTKGDIAIVAHGAVGTLLFCALTGRPITREADQPFQGHFWTAQLPDLQIEHGWRSIASRD